MWVRIVSIVVPLTIALAFIIECKFPDLQFDWITNLVESVAFFVIFLIFIFGVYWAVPPTVQITQKGVVLHHGQSHQRRSRDEIRCIEINATDSKRPILRIESSRKEFICGIAAKVDLSKLLNFLKETFPELLVSAK
jgi:hypothetical protein